MELTEKLFSFGKSTWYPLATLQEHRLTSAHFLGLVSMSRFA